jgi:hypothetical protein
MSDLEVMRFDNTAIQRVLHEDSSEKHLARMLLLMANFGKNGGPQTVVTKLSQETLAEMIGTTRSRVTFFMNKFRSSASSNTTVTCSSIIPLLNVVLHGDPEIRREKLGQAVKMST